MDSLFLIDKSKGISSHEVVKRMRALIGEKKIGHAGTLDPAAQGLLLVCVGKATKLTPFLQELDKTYQGRIIFGIFTSTLDEEGEVIENPLVTRAVMTAQKRVEGQNFEIRKHLLKYDNVMNQQREVIYKRRRMVLENEDLRGEFLECLTVGLESVLEGWDQIPEPEDVAKQIMYRYAINVRPDSISGKRAQEVAEYVIEIAEKGYSAREKILGESRMRDLEKIVMLAVIDSNWKEYLREIDDLREGISWRAYAQKDPFVEFQHEAFRMFSELMMKIDEQTAERIMKISAMEEQHQKAVFQPAKETLEHRDYSAIGASSSGQDGVYSAPAASAEGRMPDVLPTPPSRKEDTYRREDPKVGRNDPCPCGSGKKYKKCCGK